jgi:hypothetical protein
MSPVTRLRGKLLPVAAALAAFTSASLAQSPPRDGPPAWSVSVSLGDFARGNRTAVTNWLTANGYGVAEPPQCGFDVILQRVCDPPVTYPRVSESEHIGWTLGVGRRINSHASVEVLGATEQSGSAIGRCDDNATPKDARCTTRFMTIDFGGASAAALAVAWLGSFHAGAGPAVLFANWEMRPAHLAGVWIDGVYDVPHVPLFVRAQYRHYASAGFPAQHFTGFHPSTLFVGLGYAITADETRP